LLSINKKETIAAYAHIFIRGVNMERTDEFINEAVSAKTLASIIPTLVSGLYKNKSDLVREYCQNAYDAILEEYGSRASTEGRIDITINGTDIMIHDNGTGMSKEVIEKCATIGYSTKDVPTQVGYRGIGRLSGICAAEKIHFVTRTKTDPHEYTFEIDAKALIESLNREIKFTQEAAELLCAHSTLKGRIVGGDEHNHYTTVILHGVYGDSGKILNESQLRDYLEINLPVPINPLLQESEKINFLYSTHQADFPNIDCYLNKHQIFKPYHVVEGEKSFKSLTLGNVNRKLTICDNRTLTTPER
jgi:hypothetical protein